MLTRYHEAITTRVLAGHFTPAGIAIALAANLQLDHLAGQLFHPEYHVDNDVSNGYAFMSAQAAAATAAFQARAWDQGLASLGRATHVAQDIYSHTNYVRLWLAAHGGLQGSRPEDIEPLPDWRTCPGIITGQATIRSCPWLYVPVAWQWLNKILHAPPNSHFVMNIDGPERGPEFAWVLEAATRHTALIVDAALATIPGDMPYLLS